MGSMGSGCDYFVISRIKKVFYSVVLNYADWLDSCISDCYYCGLGKAVGKTLAL
jgi:hypothetical protein